MSVRMVIIRLAATYILYQEAEKGDYMYRYRLVRGKGSCWIGFHKLVMDLTRRRDQKWKPSVAVGDDDYEFNQAFGRPCG